jgi:hypothetical protein
VKNGEQPRGQIAVQQQALELLEIRIFWIFKAEYDRVGTRKDLRDRLALGQRRDRRRNRKVWFAPRRVEQLAWRENREIIVDLPVPFAPARTNSSIDELTFSGKRCQIDRFVLIKLSTGQPSASCQSPRAAVQQSTDGPLSAQLQ